jgi:hypothetical protein
MSPGPTAAVSTKRTINGSETAARKVSNIPVAIPLTAIEDVSVPRTGAAAQSYVNMTPLTECKLALSIVPN